MSTTSDKMAEARMEYAKDDMGDVERVDISEETRIHIRRKFDRHVLPLVVVLYVLSYLDRGNIGSVKPVAQPALGLNTPQWTWVLNAFYIAYTVFEWSVMLWKVFPANIYVSILCIMWGTAAMCSGAVKGLPSLIACRVFLGIFEAGFGAGVPYYLTFFYARREMALRICLVLAMSPLANCFSGALAYGLLQSKASIASWRIVFLVEGAPTILMAPVIFFLLPASPQTCNFLTESERRDAVARLQNLDKTAKTKVNWKQVASGLADYQNWMHMAMHFCCNFSFASLSNFLPTIIKEIGYTSVNANGLTAPPYFVSFCLCCAVAFYSDKKGQRGFLISGFAALGCLGYLLLAVVKYSVAVRYLAVWFAVCGIYPALCLNITWLLGNQGGDSKRAAGLSILAIFGQCSSFIGTAVFPSEQVPYFTQGCAVGCALTGVIVILSLTLHFLLKRENERRDREFGPVDHNEIVDVSELGDKNEKFRYLT